MSAHPPTSSPCVSICRIDRASGLCEGCRRSLPEIAEWLRYTEERRRQIMRELPARRLGRALSQH
ncbi:MAG: DUF1289 domain-containing protein [Gammaproteobacteria bacterium]